MGGEEIVDGVLCGRVEGGMRMMIKKGEEEIVVIEYEFDGVMG